MLGCSAAMVATRWVGAVLFHVSPLDLITCAGVVLAAAAAAAYLPARRAERINPAALLRGEA